MAQSTRVVTIRLPHNLADRVEREAHASNQTPSWLVRQLLAAHFGVEAPRRRGKEGRPINGRASTNVAP